MINDLSHTFDNPDETARRHYAQPVTRYLVCGRREDGDPDLVERALRALILHPQQAIVIHGDARPRRGHGESYDRLAGAWAARNGAHVIAEPADWNYGRAAGPIRNSLMLTDHKPDVVIAFPGGAGTADMVRQARQRRLVVIEVTE